MTFWRRINRLTATLFAGAALAFLLPFGTIACSGAETTVTGIELATWSVPDEEYGSAVEAEASPVAAIALAATLAGLALAALGRARGPGWCASLGLVALIALGAKAAYWDVQTEAGFTLAFLLTAGAGVLRLVLAIERVRTRRDLRAAAPPRTDAVTEGSEHAHV